MIKSVVGKVKSAQYALPDIVYGIESKIDKEGAGKGESRLFASQVLSYILENFSTVRFFIFIYHSLFAQSLRVGPSQNLRHYLFLCKAFQKRIGKRSSMDASLPRLKESTANNIQWWNKAQNTRTGLFSQRKRRKESRIGTMRSHQLPSATWINKRIMFMVFRQKGMMLQWTNCYVASPQSLKKKQIIPIFQARSVKEGYHQQKQQRHQEVWKSVGVGLSPNRKSQRSRQ